MEFEIIEDYLLLGERRFRVRVKGARIVFNVSASTPEEAVQKARELMERLRAERVLKGGEG